MSKWVGERPKLMKDATVQEVLEFTANPDGKLYKDHRKRLAAYRVRSLLHGAFMWFVVMIFALGIFTFLGWFR